MKANTGKLTGVKKTTARKKVIEAQGELDSQEKISQEELCRRVACKAYELFAQRGYKHGYHQEDWQQAERIIQEGLD
jgi:hypothetical protein